MPSVEEQNNCKAILIIYMLLNSHCIISSLFSFVSSVPPKAECPMFQQHAVKLMDLYIFFLISADKPNDVKIDSKQCLYPVILSSAISLWTRLQFSNNDDPQPLTLCYIDIVQCECGPRNVGVHYNILFCRQRHSILWLGRMKNITISPQ